MKNIIITILLFTTIIALWRLAEENYLYERVANTITATVPDQYADTDAIAVDDGNKLYCVGVGELSKLKVEVRIEDLGGNAEHSIAGQFVPTSRVMFLDDELGRDVNTISHEVSHLVDHILAIYPTDNDHMRAYYQGYWTQCVYTHMVEWTHREKAQRFINQMYGY